MSNMQALVDGLGAQWQRDRANTQMTLGKLIAALEAMPSSQAVVNLRNAHSYRGYYDDIAFEREGGVRHAGELLAECNAVMGRTLQGYKGGDFVMGETTPVWVAQYGCCGDKLAALNPNGTIVTTADDD